MSNRYNILDNELDNVLSDEEQSKYLELVYNGNKQAKEILFKHNLRLVSYIVEHWTINKDIDKDDLFQVGCIGLLKAIDNFDVINYNNKFSTYAGKMILGEIRRYIRDNNLIKMPRSIQELSIKIIKLKNRNTNNNLTTKEIARLLNADENDVVMALNSNQDVISLSSPVYFNHENGSEINLEEIIPDMVFPIDDLIEKIEIDAIFDKLDERERKIIKSLYGFGCTCKKNKEIAEELEISKQLLHTIKKRALEKVKILIK